MPYGPDSQPAITGPDCDPELRAIQEHRAVMGMLTRFIAEELQVGWYRQPSMVHVLTYQERRRRNFLHARRMERERVERARKRGQDTLPLTWQPEREAAE